MTHAERVASYKRAGCLLLPPGEEDPGKTYVMPDPGDLLRDAYVRAYHAVYRGSLGDDSPVTLTRRDAQRLLSLADGYLTLTTYALGQEHCVEKLRDIWRARRAADAPETP